MDSIVINGGVPLRGEINIAGAKNACLALMPAAILTSEPLTLSNVPNLTDIITMSKLLSTLGLKIEHNPQTSEVNLQGKKITCHKADYDIVRKMRASFLVLGPLVARTGQAEVSLPGGCAIGARAVDLHLMALEKLGAQLELSNGYVKAQAPRGLKGSVINFPVRSVGATENTIMAASLATGETAINNAACEPEIGDLIDCLVAMGAKIEGKNTGSIRIQGQTSLGGTRHQAIHDRIELGTYCLAAAITRGEVTLKGCKQGLNEAFLNKAKQMGMHIESESNQLNIKCNADRINPLTISTEPYPGFPTDLQAQMMAVLSLANGTSEIDERIFENRFMHVPELNRMGADIQITGSKATIKGVKKLIGAQVMATDLRASVALVLAGLAAHGTTTIRRVYHLDRGYEKLEQKLAACGAKIKREQL